MANTTATCTNCKKQFVTIEQEEKFLKEKSLPLPAQCPSCRQMRRLKLRGERALYKTTCQKCGKEIIVSYDPKTTENMILCKKDYEQYFMENDPIVKEPLSEV